MPGLKSGLTITCCRNGGALGSSGSLLPPGPPQPGRHVQVLARGGLGALGRAALRLPADGGRPTFPVRAFFESPTLSWESTAMRPTYFLTRLRSTGQQRIASARPSSPRRGARVLAWQRSGEGGPSACMRFGKQAKASLYIPCACASVKPMLSRRRTWQCVQPAAEQTCCNRLGGCPTLAVFRDCAGRADCG